MKRKILSIVLTLMMMVSIFPFSAFAAEISPGVQSLLNMDEKIPTGFREDLAGPFGGDIGEYFLLKENTEMFSLCSYANRDYQAEAKARRGLNLNSGAAKLEDKFSSGITYGNLPEVLNWTKAVSFDPKGIDRRNCVAIVGATPTGEVKVYVLDTAELTWSAPVTLGYMDWSYSRYTEYQIMTNFIDITAGDYDGDGKDSLIVYGAYDRDRGSDRLNSYAYGLTELTVRFEDEKPIINEPGYADQRLLNWPYYESNLPSTFCDDEACYGVARLTAVLGTGDLNNDGIDDLCVVSYHNGSVKWWRAGRNAYDYRCFMPCLEVSLGGSGSVLKTGKGEAADWRQYIEYNKGNDSVNSIHAIGMTVANVDNIPGDDIVLAGEKRTYYLNGGKMSDIAMGQDQSTRTMVVEKLSCPKGQFISDTFDTMSVEGSKLSEPITINNFTAAGIYDHSDYGWAPISVESVYFNGRGQAADLLIAGDIYTLSSDVLNKVYDFEYLNDSDDGIGSCVIGYNFIDSAAAGNFDHNPYGYEQIALTLGRKQSGDDDYFFNRVLISVKDSARDANTHLLKNQKQDAFNLIGVPDDNYTMYEGNDHYDYGLACLIAPVDVEKDGLYARYIGAEYFYSDPHVEAILQAPPVYKELVDKGLQGDSSDTKYTITKTKELSEGTSESSCVGWSSSSDSTFSFLDIQLLTLSSESGTSTELNKDFVKSISSSTSRGWSVAQQDKVLLYRTPIILYQYETYNEMTGGGAETTAVSCSGNPVMATLTLDEYNEFVDIYNKKYQERYEDETGLMTPLDAKENYLGVEGNPGMYKSGLNAKKLGNEQEVSTGGGTQDFQATLSVSAAETTSERKTESFAMTTKFDLIGSSISGNTSASFANSTALMEATEWQVSGTVSNLGSVSALKDAGYTDIGKYLYTWTPYVWDSTIPDDVYEEEGDQTMYVPVYGYAVSGATADIIFHTNGGTIDGENEPVSRTYKEGLIFSLPTPAKIGYTFIGWYDNPDFEGTPIEKITQKDSGDKEFWAKWERMEGVWLITLNFNGGTSSSYPKSYNEGQGAALPKPEKKDMEFGGWYDNPDFEGEPIEAITQSDTGDKEFWARWVNTHAIRYHPDYGRFKKPIDRYAEGVPVYLPTLTKAGFTFLGWYDNSNFEGEPVTMVGLPGDTTDKEFWALWIEDSKLLITAGNNRVTYADNVPSDMRGVNLNQAELVTPAYDVLTENGNYEVYYNMDVTDADDKSMVIEVAPMVRNADTNEVNPLPIGDRSINLSFTLPTALKNAGTIYITQDTPSGRESYERTVQNGCVNLLTDIPAATYTLSTEPEAIPEFTGCSVSLQSRIAVNFYLNCPGITGAEGTMSYEITGKGDITGTTKGQLQKNGQYMFTCFINSLQMADTITATFSYGNGQSISLNYSIQQYIERMANSSQDNTVVKVVKSMADFGYFTQQYLSQENEFSVGYGENDAYCQMICYNYSPDTQLDLERFAVQRNNEITDIVNIGTALVLDSYTTLRVALDLQNDYVPKTVTAKFEGDKKYLSCKTEVGQDGLYYIVIPDIAVHQLGDTIELKIDNKETIKASALSHAYNTLSSNSTAMAKKAMAALYTFYVDAMTYAGKTVK